MTSLLLLLPAGYVPLIDIVSSYVPPPSCGFTCGASRCVAPNMNAEKSVSLLEEPADELQLAGARFARKAAYTSVDSSWPEFTYSPSNERRDAVREFSASALPDDLPPLRIMLVGGPATGKGTIGPMLVQAFRCRAIGIGTLLRSQARAGTSFGRMHAEAIARGEPLDDAVVLDMLSERLLDSWDMRRNGWLLDGFPRSAAQARAVLDSDGSAGVNLRPDCVVVLDRPGASPLCTGLDPFADPSEPLIAISPCLLPCLPSCLLLPTGHHSRYQPLTRGTHGTNPKQLAPPQSSCKRSLCSDA